MNRIIKCIYNYAIYDLSSIDRAKVVERRTVVDQQTCSTSLGHWFKFGRSDFCFHLFYIIDHLSYYLHMKRKIKCMKQLCHSPTLAQLVERRTIVDQQTCSKSLGHWFKLDLIFVFIFFILSTLVQLVERRTVVDQQTCSTSLGHWFKFCRSDFCFHLFYIIDHLSYYLHMKRKIKCMKQLCHSPTLAQLVERRTIVDQQTCSKSLGHWFKLDLIFVFIFFILSTLVQLVERRWQSGGLQWISRLVVHPQVTGSNLVGLIFVFIFFILSTI